MTIVLDNKEILYAYSGAISRFNRVKSQGLSFQKDQYQHRLGFHESDHVCGAISEFAFCKMLNLDWSPTLETLDHGDVGNFEVKSSYNSTGNLLIPSTYSGNKNLIFVFAIVSPSNSNVEFKGWIHGKEALTDKYWNSRMRRPCWFIPVQELQNMRNIIQ